MKHILCNIIGGIGIALTLWGEATVSLGRWFDKKAYEIWSR